MNTRSIILSGEEAVTVEIGEGRHNTIEKAVASFDGGYPDIHGHR